MAQRLENFTTTSDPAIGSNPTLDPGPLPVATVAITTNERMLKHPQFFDSLSSGLSSGLSKMAWDTESSGSEVSSNGSDNLSVGSEVSSNGSEDPSVGSEDLFGPIKIEIPGPHSETPNHAPVPPVTSVPPVISVFPQEQMKSLNQHSVTTSGEMCEAMETKCNADKCGVDSLHPILDPRFNMRETAKQCLLLEDHLNNTKKRCYDCIRKHFLTVDGFLEEAVSLEKDNMKRNYYRQLYLDWVKLQKQYAKNPKNSENLDEVSKLIRMFRKPLVEKYFDTVSEYED